MSAVGCSSVSLEGWTRNVCICVECGEIWADTASVSSVYTMKAIHFIPHSQSSINCLMKILHVYVSLFHRYRYHNKIQPSKNIYVEQLKQNVELDSNFEANRDFSRTHFVDETKYVSPCQTTDKTILAYFPMSSAWHSPIILKRATKTI